MTHYDSVVIGSGPAGQRAAIQAAELGRSVALMERSFSIGGACVHTGTIPSKTLREAVLSPGVRASKRRTCSRSSSATTTRA